MVTISKSMFVSATNSSSTEQIVHIYFYSKNLLLWVYKNTFYLSNVHNRTIVDDETKSLVKMIEISKNKISLAIFDLEQLSDSGFLSDKEKLTQIIAPIIYKPVTIVSKSSPKDWNFIQHTDIIGVLINTKIA